MGTTIDGEPIPSEPHTMICFGCHKPISISSTVLGDGMGYIFFDHHSPVCTTFNGLVKLFAYQLSLSTAVWSKAVLGENDLQ